MGDKNARERENERENVKMQPPKRGHETALIFILNKQKDSTIAIKTTIRVWS